MNKVNLQKLIDKASEMAMCNIWGENAYKINAAILKTDHNNCAACTRLAKYYKLNDNISEAENMYLMALEIDPCNRGAINNLNEIKKDQKENEEVEKIETTVELIKQGQKSMVKGKYKLASKLFLKAFSIEPLLANAVNLAGAYKGLGNYDSIEKLFTQLTEGKHKKADIDNINKEFKLMRLNRNSI